MLFDTHAHYDDPAFDPDRDEVIRSLPESGVGLVLIPGCNLETSRQAVALADEYPYVYAAIGCHPQDAHTFLDSDLEEYRKLALHPKVVAVGEIGLDYYWEQNPPRELQQEVFRKQMALAEELSLPVIIHNRDAHQDTLEIVKEFPKVKGVFHCFSGSPEYAKILLKQGWYLGFDGPITFKNAKKNVEAVRITPLDRLVIETDSPYMSPVPVRGQRNDSRNLKYIVAKLAEIKEITVEEAEKATTENGLDLFRRIEVQPVDAGVEKEAEELTLDATVENVGTVLSFLNERLEGLNCSPKTVMQFDIAVEELFVNIANYAYQPGTGQATVRLEEKDEPKRVSVTLVDRGIPYDPLSKPDPDVTLSADERPIGGLGIFMVKSYVDAIRYERRDGQNVLTVEKKI